MLDANKKLGRLRVLFVHEVGYIDKVAFEMHEFPELLSLAGHDVTFFEFSENRNRNLPVFSSFTREISGRVYPEARINLVTPVSFGLGEAQRYIAPLTHIPKLNALLRSGQFDVIVLYAVPTTGWQTVMLAKFYGIPLVFRAIDVSHKLRRGLFSRLILTAERYIYAHADLISANNESLLAYCQQLGSRQGPSRVDLPPVDISHFQGTPTSSQRMLLGIPEDSKVIVYMGTFYRFSGLGALIQSLADVDFEKLGLHLLLVGGGEQEQELKEKVEKLGLSQHVTFTGFVDYSLLPAYLGVADVAVTPFEMNLVTENALPHKTFQYMASGIPVVSTSLSGIKATLGIDSGVTWVSSPQDVLSAAVSVVSLDRDDQQVIIAAQSECVRRLFGGEPKSLGMVDAANQAIAAKREATTGL